ncbi:MAG TPA: hypothetical protein PLZ51_11820, partial [Aggregatilineales bacterium]|nr:hypothetical protein [Aggregatilineales bacterium]
DSYYWFVAPMREGIIGTWSAMRQFDLTITPPAPPNLIEPAQASTLTTAPITFTWDAMTGAYRYHIEIARDAQFTQLVDEHHVLTTPTYSLPLTDSGVYYWRVTAYFVNVQALPSAVGQFTLSLLPAPILIAPIDTQSTIDPNMSFSWESVVGATGYRLQIANDNAFTDIIKQHETAETALASSNQAGTYYWRVQATDGAINGTWSEIRSYTITPLGIPTIITPADMTTTTNGAVTFSWDAVPNATGYQLQISMSSGMTNAILDQTLTDTSYVYG